MSNNLKQFNEHEHQIVFETFVERLLHTYSNIPEIDKSCTNGCLVNILHELTV